MISQSEFQQRALLPEGVEAWPTKKNEALTWTPARQFEGARSIGLADWSALQSVLSTVPGLSLGDVQHRFVAPEGLEPLARFWAGQELPALCIEIHDKLDQVLELDLPEGRGTLQVIAHPGATAEIALKGGANNALSVEWMLHDNAYVSVRELFQSQTQLRFHSAQLQKDAKLHVVSVNSRQGAVAARQSWRVELQGAQSHVDLRVLNLCHQGAAAHQHVQILHAVPQATSSQIVAQVLGQGGVASFDGTVEVARDAQQTFSEQIVRSLLLADDAKAHCKPNLRIFADDVKCSHGNTCGELDPDALFYLRSRGVPARQARDLLVLGFCEVVLEDMYSDSLKPWLHQAIQQELAQMDEVGSYEL